MMWYDGAGGMQWWGWLLGAFMMVAFWGLVIWGIWYLVTGRDRSDAKPATAVSAREVLDMRLARGEIDAEEYGRLREAMDRPAGALPAERRTPAPTSS